MNTRRFSLTSLAVLCCLLLVGQLSAQSPLTTTFVGGNGQKGNMFDVKSLTGVVIQTFDIHFTGGPGDFEVWALNAPGTYLGNQTSNANWTLIGTVTGLASAGANTPTPMNLSLGFPIPAGVTQAFYITATTASPVNLSYTNGTATGSLYTSNTDLEFYEGHGGTYFNLTFNPRVWNGNIHYTPLSFFADDVALFNIVAPQNTTLDCSARSATETVTVDIINLGTNPVLTGTLLQLSFTVDGGTPNIEFLSLAADLNQGQVLQYTFTATADLSALGNHTVATNVTYGLDLDGSNDSMSVQIGSGGALRVTSYPFSEDFNPVGGNGSSMMPIGFIQETTDGTGLNADWFLRTDNTPTNGTGPSADHTGGSSGYIYVEDAGNFSTVNLRTPCFDLGALVSPTLRFFLHSNNASTTGADNTLSVDVISYPSTTVTMDVAGPLTSQGNNWVLQSIDLSAFSGQVIQMVLRVDSSLSSGAHDIAVDDFSVVELQATPGQAPQPGLAVLDLNNPTNINGDPLPFGFGGPYFSSVSPGTTLIFKMSGEPMQPIILFAGALNPAVASFTNIGIIDCGGPVDPLTGLPTALTILADGTQAVQGGFHPFFVTAANGEAEVGFTVPALPTGVLSTFQCAFFVTGGAGLALSNAVQLTIL